MMEELPLVNLLATGPLKPVVEDDSCEDCSKVIPPPLMRQIAHSEQQGVVTTCVGRNSDRSTGSGSTVEAAESIYAHGA